MKKVKEKKYRAHKALFDEELPFQPRVERVKNRYTRKPKHKRRNDEDLALLLL
jgi:hypothetical protein